MTNLWIMFGLTVLAVLLAVVLTVKLNVRTAELETAEEELAAEKETTLAQRQAIEKLTTALGTERTAKYDAQQKLRAETDRVTEAINKSADATTQLAEASAALGKASQDVAYWKAQAEEARSATVISSSSKAKTV